MLRLVMAGLVLCGSVRADVLVLDAAGGGDFTTVQQVVDGTHDGDIVIVRPGDYGFQTAIFGGKSLSIVADGTGPVNFPSLGITDIQVGQTFVLRGVRVVNDNPGVTDLIRLQVYTSPGTVILEDCTIEGSHDPSTTVKLTALNISVSNVVVESCEIIGGKGGDHTMTFGDESCVGGWGLRALAAHIAMSDCTITGGAGGDDVVGDVLGAAAGGVGIIVVDCELALSGCTVTGGAGGHDTGPPLAQGPPTGGTALVADAESTLRLRDTTLTGGAGGTDAGGSGHAGDDLAAPGATVVTLDGPARTIQVGAPLTVGGSAQLVASGAPGELVLLIASPEATWHDVPKFEGTLVVGSTLLGPLAIGVLDGAGQLQLGVSVPPLGLGAGEGMPVIIQVAGTLGASVVLGDASATVVLGS